MRVVEQHGVLRHHADHVAQRALRHVGDVLAVDGDAALLRLVEAEDEARQGGLAGARGADDGHRLARRHLEADALEDLAARIVVEVHVLEGEPAIGDDQRRGAGAILDLRVLLENAEHGLDVDQRLRTSR
jgi:hypothetical protein